MAKSVSQIMASLDQLKDNDGTADGHNRGRSAFACGILGALGGAMVGYSKKWNLFYSAIGGAAIGSVIGVAFTKNS